MVESQEYVPPQGEVPEFGDRPEDFDWWGYYNQHDNRVREWHEQNYPSGPDHLKYDPRHGF